MTNIYFLNHHSFTLFRSTFEDGDFDVHTHPPAQMPGFCDTDTKTNHFIAFSVSVSRGSATRGSSFYYRGPQRPGRGPSEKLIVLLSKQIFETWIQFDVVFTQVAKQLVCPQNLGNSHQLQTRTAFKMEEGIVT